MLFPLGSQQDQLNPGEGQECMGKHTAEGGVMAWAPRAARKPKATLPYVGSASLT